MNCLAGPCIPTSSRRIAVMSEPNPYQPPGSPVTVSAAPPAYSSTSRAVDAGRGWEWLVEGFALFKKQPGTWILILIVFIVCATLIHLVPVIGSLAGVLLTQVFMGGLMLGCATLARGETLELNHLFAGFKQNTGDLVVLGVLTVAGWILALIPAVVVAGGGAFMSMMMGGSPAMHVGAMGFSFFLALLVVLALAVPLYMALWFAPSLIVFNQLKPVEAMKASFFACLKNIVPFLLYGAILVVLCIIAAIPFGLGFLVLAPVTIGSIYVSYREIFAAD
jgi:hypothetical protein